MGRATNIFVEWRLRRQALTLADFLKDINSKLNKSNFVDYFKQKLQECWRSAEIGELSFRAQQATLHKVREFCPSLMMTSC